MNAHIKTLMNVSGIAKRNDRLSLFRTGKGNNNVLMSCSPLIKSCIAADRNPNTLPEK